MAQEEARSGTEGARTPTLEQYVDHQKSFETRSSRGRRAALGASSCREVGHFSRNCPKKRVQAPGNDAGVRAVSSDLELKAIADVLSAHESHLEKSMKRKTVERPVGRRSSRSVLSPRLCGRSVGTTLAFQRAPNEVQGV